MYVGGYIAMFFFKVPIESLFFVKFAEIHEISEIPPYKIDHNFFVRGSFRANKGSKRSYAITAFQKNRGYQKIFIFEKVADQNVTLANRKIRDVRGFSITGP